MSHSIHAFISFRFQEATTEALQLRDALARVGVNAYMDTTGNGDNVFRNIANALIEAKVAIILGTSTYGKETNGMFDTSVELGNILGEKKLFVLVKMCEQWEEPVMRLKFGGGTIGYTKWMAGTPMPDDLVPVILRKLADAGVQVPQPQAACISQRECVETKSEVVAAVTENSHVGGGIEERVYLFRRGSQYGCRLCSLNLATRRWTAHSTLDAFTDREGWGYPKYLSTIRVVAAAGQVFVAGRGSRNIHLFAYNPTSDTWNARPSLPFLTDEMGWDTEKHYSTFQVVAGGQRLFCVGRGINALHLATFDLTANEWTVHQEFAAMTDKTGWDLPKCYGTIRAIAGGQSLYVVGRGADGLHLCSFDVCANRWEKHEPLDFMSDRGGWWKEKNWRSVRAAWVGEEVVVYGRGTSQAHAAAFSTTERRWRVIQGMGCMADRDGWDHPAWYNSIRLVAAPGPSGSLGEDCQQALVVGLGSNGVDVVGCVLGAQGGRWERRAHAACAELCALWRCAAAEATEGSGSHGGAGATMNSRISMSDSAGGESDGGAGPDARDSAPELCAVVASGRLVLLCVHQPRPRSLEGGESAAAGVACAALRLADNTWEHFDGVDMADAAQ